MYLKKVDGRYSFRFRVPNDLRAAFGRQEVIKALKTKNARIAKQKARILSGELMQIIDKARTMNELDIKGIDKIVNEWLSERLEADLSGRISKSSIEGYKGKMPLSKLKGYTERSKNDYAQDLAKLKTMKVQELSSALIGEQIDESNPQHKRLMFQMMRASVELFSTLTERNEGKIPFIGPKTLNEIVEESKTYQEAIDEYLPELLAKSQKRVKKTLTAGEKPKQYTAYEKFLTGEFLEVVGANSLMPNRIDDIKLKALIRKDGSTARDKAETIKAFYSWLKDNGYTQRDFGKLLFFNTVPKTRRKAFTSEMIKRILSESKGEINTFFKLYLYTGVRRAELFHMDFVEGGFQINDGKNINALRFIPRHTALEMVSDDEILRLQTQWSPDYIGRKLNDFISEKIGKGYSLHSTRHSFNTQLVTRGVKPTIIKQLMGHEQNSNVTDMTDYYTTYFEEDGDKTKAINLINYNIGE